MFDEGGLRPNPISTPFHFYPFPLTPSKQGGGGRGRNGIGPKSASSPFTFVSAIISRGAPQLGAAAWLTLGGPPQALSWGCTYPLHQASVYFLVITPLSLSLSLALAFSLLP